MLLRDLSKLVVVCRQRKLQHSQLGVGVVKQGGRVAVAATGQRRRLAPSHGQKAI